MPHKPLRRLLSPALTVVLAWLDLSCVYLIVLTLAAGRPRASSRERSAEERGGPTAPKLITLVPAHDEERTIESCISSLQGQAYAGEHEIVVVADNCLDATAELARALGATVWERHSEQGRGKGHALAFGLARLQPELGNTAGIIVMDADCQASSNLCTAVATALTAGAAALQADYRIANPGDSAAAARRAAGFALIHRIRGAGKSRLGLSCGLFGTGMAFTPETLAAVPWTSFSITEDAQYHVALVQSHRRVLFVPEAWVSTPAPVTEAQAQAQQLRWVAGKAVLTRRTIRKLVTEGARSGDPQQIHLAGEQLVPPQSVLAAGLVATGVIGGLARARTPRRLAAAGVTMQCCHVALGLLIANVPREVWLALATSPASVARRLSQYSLILRGQRPTTWTRTQRL